MHAEHVRLADSLGAFAASLLFHAAIFSTFGIGAYLLAQVCRRVPWPRPAYAIASWLVCWIVCAQVLRAIVLPSISFEGSLANFFSIVFADACSSSFSESGRKRATWWINLACAAPVGLVPSGEARRWSRFCAHPLMRFPLSSGPGIGISVLQKTSVLLLWAFAGRSVLLGRPALANQATSDRHRGGGYHRGVRCGCAEGGLGQRATRAGADSLERYAGNDISFKTAYAVVARSVSSDHYNAFYDFLKSRTNIREPPGPANVSLVANLGASSGAKPNIFHFCDRQSAAGFSFAL